MGGAGAISERRRLYVCNHPHHHPMIVHKGISHLLALVLYAVTVQKAVHDSLEGDNQITWRDGFKLWPAAKGARQAFADAKEAIPELADLDGDEAQQLVEAVQAQLGDSYAPAHVRDITAKALKAAPPLVDLYDTIAHAPPVAQPA